MLVVAAVLSACSRPRKAPRVALTPASGRLEPARAGEAVKMVNVPELASDWEVRVLLCLAIGCFLLMKQMSAWTRVADFTMNDYTPLAV